MTTGLTKEEALEVLSSHEWHYKENLTHVMCPSCGAQYRETAKRRNHRPGCNWVKLTLLVGYALAIQGVDQ
jgi:predicted RNA-binding Zn-ribbon protein involved in translation (DUF1610 family)